MVASLVVYVTLNDRLYGGLVPSAVAASGEPPTGADSAGDYLERVPRLAALWIDRDVGLLRWAPVLALTVFAVWLLWRSRRAHVARRGGRARRRRGRRGPLAAGLRRACSPWRRSPPRR